MGQQPLSAAPNPPAILTERQAAAYLAVSLSTIRRWRHNHIGPEFFRFGDILRYSREARSTTFARRTPSKPRREQSHGT